MPPTREERTRIKQMLLDRYTDWAGVHAALAGSGHALSQSTLERFFNGRSDSARTLRLIASLLGTTPSALLLQVEPSAASPAKATRLADSEAYRVAYQLWVEMTTRKIGLPIDLSHDLVAEVYDSWYAFFKTARELIKAIPLHKNPQCAQMRQLVALSQAVLNKGLRPHLERWQGRFRHWSALGGDRAQSPGRTPQEAQALFPEWAQLREDLLAANRRLVGYLTSLELMLGKPGSPSMSASPRRNR